MIRRKFFASFAAAAALVAAGGVAWSAADTNPNVPHEHGTASYTVPGTLGFVDVRYWACVGGAANRLGQITGQIQILETFYVIEPTTLFLPCNVAQMTVNTSVTLICPDGTTVPACIVFQYTSNLAGTRADPFMDIDLPTTVPPSTQSGEFNHWN